MTANPGKQPSAGVEAPRTQCGRGAEFVAVGALQASTIGLEVEADVVDTDHSVGSGEVPAVYQRDWRRATRAGHRSARRRLGLRQRLKLRQGEE